MTLSGSLVVRPVALSVPFASRRAVARALAAVGFWFWFAHDNGEAEIGWKAVHVHEVSVPAAA